MAKKQITPAAQAELEALVASLEPPSLINGRKASAERRLDAAMGRAASVLGTDKRQIERWMRGTGKTDRSDQAQIRKAASDRAISSLAQGAKKSAKEPDVRRALRSTARGNPKTKSGRRRIIREQIKILDKDKAPTIYEKGS